MRLWGTLATIVKLQISSTGFMTQVTVGENEGIESALRRFKRQVSKAGIFADLKRLRHHETPVEKYKRKAQQRRRRR